MDQTTTATGGASSVQDRAQDAADQAREKAREGAQRARSGLREQIDRRSTDAGRRVGTQADDLRAVGQQLREQGKDGPARIADQAADRARRVGSWLEESDGDRILHEVEDFARRNAWAVALGGFALGFAGSRMLRASSTDRYERDETYGYRQVPAQVAPGEAGNGPGLRGTGGPGGPYTGEHPVDPVIEEPIAETPGRVGTQRREGL
jgi:hypothetical protein